MSAINGTFHRFVGNFGKKLKLSIFWLKGAFLDFFVDSVKQAYILLEDKKFKFIHIREEILAQPDVDVRTLQRFCGKCISMGIAVPGCQLFCR